MLSESLNIVVGKVATDLPYNLHRKVGKDIYLTLFTRSADALLIGMNHMTFCTQA
jgi:hypothetical protein